MGCPTPSTPRVPPWGCVRPCAPLRVPARVPAGTCGYLRVRPVSPRACLCVPVRACACASGSLAGTCVGACVCARYLSRARGCTPGSAYRRSCSLGARLALPTARTAPYCTYWRPTAPYCTYCTYWRPRLLPLSITLPSPITIAYYPCSQGAHPRCPSLGFHPIPMRPAPRTCGAPVGLMACTLATRPVPGQLRHRLSGAFSAKCRN